VSKRKATAQWQGSLRDGRGKIRLHSGAFEGPYDFASRFESGRNTNPEELVGAALAGCYAMAFTVVAEQNGNTPRDVEVEAEVELEQGEEGFTIPSIRLYLNAVVPGLEEKEFERYARQAKDSCVIAKALRGVEIELRTSLKEAAQQ
jgi:lipoyl-dependent peroxiredoxin